MGPTVHPANADGLTEGEEEQGGAAADMVIQQLEQVYPSLKTRERQHFLIDGNSHYKRHFQTKLIL